MHVSQRYKDENEKIVEELKAKAKEVRDQMENTDLKLIECFHSVI